MRRNLVISILLIGGLALLLPVFLGSGHADGTASSGSNFTYGTTSLIGANPGQVGQFATQFVQHQLKVTAISQVLLSRPATTEEMATLGLACIFPGGGYDKQALMFVILKGNFDFSTMPTGATSVVPQNQTVSYVAYLFDLKSAHPVYLTGSKYGGKFRRALNNPNLPEDYPTQLAESNTIAATPCTDPGVHTMMQPTGVMPSMGSPVPQLPNPQPTP